MTGARPRLRGVIPAILTAFNKEGEIDLEGQRAFVSWLVQNGIHGIFACGTGGDYLAMSVSDRMKVMEATVEANAGRVPVLAQTGHYATKTTIELSRHAMSLGVDALAIITPYYLPRGDEEFYRHYALVREAVDLPIIMYHNPAFAGPNLAPDLIARMYQDNLIVGLKDSSGEVGRNVNMRLMCGPDFIMIHGLDVFPVESFLMGANAWVAGVANVLPREFGNVYNLAAEGNWSAVRDEWFRLKPFVNFCTTPKEGRASYQMQIYHSGVRMRGVPVGYTPFPGIPLEERGEYGAGLLSQLRSLLEQLGHPIAA